jgi:mannosyltransferase
MSGPHRALDRTTVVLLLVLVAAKLVLGSAALTRDGIWLDEALSVHVAQGPLSLSRHAAHEPTPPLYYLLLSGWQRVFGDSLESARLLSTLLGVATVVLLFDLGRRHFGRETAVVATALFVASRLQVHYGGEARTYALVGLLCVASFDVLLSLAERPSWVKAIALALLDAALVYAHYVAVFALVAQLGGALVLAPRATGFLVRYAASQAIAALLFAPQLLVLLHEGINQKDWIGPPTIARARYVLKRFAGTSSLLIAYAVLAGAVAWLRRRMPAHRRPSSDRGKLIALALWAFLPVSLAYAASFVREMLLDRYVLYASAGLYLLVGYLLAIAPLRTPVRAAIAAAFVLASLVESIAHPIRRHDWRRVAEIVHVEEKRNARVIVAPSWHFRPLAYHLDRDAFRDHEQTRTRLEARGIFLTDDPRTASLDAQRLLLVLAPEVTPSPREAQAWLAARGYATSFEDLHGLTVLRAERVSPGERILPLP